MIYIIANKNSKKGSKKENLEALLNVLSTTDTQYEIKYTEYAGHAAKIAEEITSLPGKKRIIVIGGDGTINEAINGIKDFENTEFGYVPFGSGNDLARGLKIKSKKEERLINLVTGTNLESMDLGEVICEDKTRRYFAVSSGVGLDAFVCKCADSSKLKRILNKIGLGSLTYGILTVKSLFTMDTSNAKLVYTNDNETKNTQELPVKNMIFTAIMNNPYEGGGVPMSPNAKSNDGLLSICCVGNIKKLKTFFLFPLLLMGKQGKLKGFNLFNSKDLEIILTKPMVIHADGEYMGTFKKAAFKTHKNKLNLISE